MVIKPPAAIRRGLRLSAARVLYFASIPKQTRDGWPVIMGPGVMPGPADTFIAYGQGWANVSNTPFREHKHWVHEGGVSTPLIARGPIGGKNALVIVDDNGGFQVVWADRQLPFVG